MERTEIRRCWTSSLTHFRSFLASSERFPLQKLTESDWLLQIWSSQSFFIRQVIFKLCLVPLPF